MAGNTNTGAGARRAAHALVHTLGATCIHLQMPTPPIANDDGEELGLRSPEFQLQALAPAALRWNGAETEVILPADVLEDGLGVQGEGAVKAAVPTACRVQIGNESFLLRGIDSLTAGGSECLYRLLLQTPATEVV